jgi:hypothetical protein
MQRYNWFLICLLALIVAPAVRADQVFTAKLLGSNEVPPQCLRGHRLYHGDSA